MRRNLRGRRMSAAIILAVVRRTITLPDALDTRVRAVAGDGESFSGAVSRLLEASLREHRSRPAWIGSGESGDPELALHVEEVLAELATDEDLGG